MKNKTLRRFIAIIAAAVMAFAMLCSAGCFTSMIGIEGGKPDFSIPYGEFTEDDKGAAAAVARYFAAFAAKDAEGMTDTMWSGCMESYASANDSSRENLLSQMQSNLDAIISAYGEDFVMKYDITSFRSEDVTDSVGSLNKELGIDTETETGVDMARVITADVWFVDDNGKEFDRQNGSLLAYRYDGEWYINV